MTDNQPEWIIMILDIMNLVWRIDYESQSFIDFGRRCLRLGSVFMMGSAICIWAIVTSMEWGTGISHVETKLP